MAPQPLLRSVPHFRFVLGRCRFLDLSASDVRRHDHHGVFEIHGAPLAVGQSSIVQQLQQHVEDVMVRLFDLIEQDDAIRPSPHGFGELAALLMTDVPGRRADQPRHRVLFHVLGHINPDHRLFVVKEKFRQGSGKLRLADAGGP